MSTTFAQLKTTIQEQIFPEGLAENLATPFAKAIKDALIDLQRWVPCLQYYHLDLYPQSSTYYQCGKTILDVPDSGKAIIESVSVIITNYYCRDLIYRQAEHSELLCWSRSLVDLVNDPANTNMPVLPLGYHYPDATTDSEYGRALVGMWSIYKNKLYVAPWLQSDESLVVQWMGKKLSWADADTVPEDEDVIRAIGLFVRKDHPEWFDNGTEFYAKWRADFEEIRADLMHECRERTRVREDNTCREDVEQELVKIFNDLYGTDTEEPHPTHADTTTNTDGGDTIIIHDDDESEVDFCFISDYGEDDGDAVYTRELAVSELIKGRALHFICTAGDNWNPASGDTPPEYDNSVGKYFADYIFPYKGNLLYGPGATVNHFFPGIGNHDYNEGDNTLDEFSDYFDAPKLNYPYNGRYYEKAVGAVHLFFINSTVNEPDGYVYNSTQAEHFKTRIALSTAPWKIVICHRPPYSSGPHGSTSDLQWPFDEWGVDLVLSGHDHTYERLEVDDVTYVVCGIGGRNLYEFGTILTESKAHYNSKNGALFINATCSTLTGTALSVDDDEIDTFTLTK